ncbi:MAG: hypothetical protein QM500_09120 [Methylococcales bacterium]
MNKSLLLLGAVSILLLAGCGSTKQVQRNSSDLVLNESDLKASKGDVEKLYNGWIKPHIKPGQNGEYVFHNNRRHRYNSEVVIKDGFSRFCNISEGSVETTYNGLSPVRSSQTHYTCRKDDGEFIGKFSVERFKDFSLEVLIKTPKRAQRNEAIKAAFDAMQEKNGPTGRIITKNGTYKFIRFGDFNNRQPIKVTLSKKPYETIYLEEALRLDLDRECCTFNIHLKDGRKMSELNTLKYMQQTHVNAYTGGVFHAVVIDPKSKQPYTRKFRNSGIKSILIDKNNYWKDKPITIISTKFKLVTKKRIKQYRNMLKVKANKLYDQLKQSGLLKALPDGKIPPRVITYLRDTLNGYAYSTFGCKADVSTGVSDKDMEDILKCNIAKQELNMVVNTGYSMVTNVTPLSSVIVLEKIRDELTYRY